VNPSLPPRLKPRSLALDLVERLSAEIAQGQWPAGQKLPTESAIMARFGVSRTVVREAISRLQAGGLVDTRHGVGTFVKASQEQTAFRIAPEDFATVADVISLLELRISLETEAAGLAAQRREEAQLRNLEGALAAFALSITDTSDTVPSDFQFHMEVASATGNHHFADLMTYLGTVLIPRTRVQTADKAPEGRMAYLSRVHQEHLSIFEAIQRQDPETARAAMRTHLSNSRERLRRAQVETH